MKTFTVRYKCCYGYKRNTEAGGGCAKSGELKSVMDTLDDIKTDEFKKLIETTGMVTMFNDGNYSLFVPTDYAMNEYNDKMNEMVRTYKQIHKIVFQNQKCLNFVTFLCLHRILWTLLEDVVLYLIRCPPKN